MTNFIRSAGVLFFLCLIPLLAHGQNNKTSGFWQSTQKKDYTIDREEIFEFAKKPSLKRNGDQTTISFETKGFCDVTVVIENTKGDILRHLASGVLGPNAPEPFEKKSKVQEIIWDGKNDLGRYVDEKENVVIRVSLGLKPQFEKTLFWHPKKIAALRRNPIAVAQPEGVYVYEGGGVEQVLGQRCGMDFFRSWFFPRQRTLQLLELSPVPGSAGPVIYSAVYPRTGGCAGPKRKPDPADGKIRQRG